MFSHNGRISNRQTAIILMIQMLNMGTLLLPGICTSYCGRDGYWLPLLAIIPGIVYLFLITKVNVSFKGQSIEQIEQSLSKPVVRLISLLLVLHLMVGLVLELRLFGEMILQMMLDKTPLAIVLLLSVLSAGYLAKSGLEAVGRMGEIMAYFIFIPLLIIVLLLIFKTDYHEVMPFMKTKLENVYSGTGIISLWFMPLEVMLILGSLMKEPEKAFKIASFSMIIMAVFQALMVLFTICRLGPVMTRSQVWPMITLFRSMGLSSGVVEKQEILILVLWIFSNFMYLATVLSASSILLSRNFRYKRENIFILPLTIIAFFMAMWPSNFQKMYKLYIQFRYGMGLCFLLVIPLLILIIVKGRRRINAKS